MNIPARHYIALSGTSFVFSPSISHLILKNIEKSMKSGVVKHKKSHTGAWLKGVL
jgi:hypothetical protein